MAVNNLKTTKWRHLVQVFDYGRFMKIEKEIMPVVRSSEV